MKKEAGSDKKIYLIAPEQDQLSNPAFPLRAIFYHPFIKDTPYFAAIDGDKYAEYLSTIGVPDEQIRDLVVFFEPSPKQPIIDAEKYKYLGAYSPEANVLSIYPDSLYASYSRNLRKAEKIASAKSNPGKVVRRVTMSINRPFTSLTTTRLADYLLAAPQERGIAFAKKLLQNNMQDALNTILQHESQHMLDRAELVKKNNDVRMPFYMRARKKLSIASGIAASAALAPLLASRHQLTSLGNDLFVGFGALETGVGMGLITAVGLGGLAHRNYRAAEEEKRARRRESMRDARRNPMMYLWERSKS